MLFVPFNIQAPAAITITFRSPVWGCDLTTVTGINLNVLRRDGSTAVWVMSQVSSTPLELVAQYVFTNTGEITTSGLYTLAPQLAVQGGILPADTISMFVATSTAVPKLEDTAWISATSVVSTSSPIKHIWKRVTPADSPYTASPIFPWVIFDLTTAPITCTLWSANDGDMVVLDDYLFKGNINNLTLNGAAGQLVLTSSATYASSALIQNAGFNLRLKYFAGTSSWIRW